MLNLIQLIQGMNVIYNYSKSGYAGALTSFNHLGKPDCIIFFMIDIFPLNFVWMASEVTVHSVVT